MSVTTTTTNNNNNNKILVVIIINIIVIYPISTISKCSLHCACRIIRVECRYGYF